MCASSSDDVKAVQEEFAKADGLSFTDPSQAHVTIKFLGDCDPGRTEKFIEELELSVEDAAVDPFEAKIRGLGVFPSLDYIRVIWLGFERGSEQISRLARTVEQRFTAIGFDAEEHDFTPHVTIARMKHAGDKQFVQDIVRDQDPTIGSMKVDEVHLTRSNLTESGPVYETVATVSI
ncbi:MAG: RNA 2',3'-cyclic phosphodiesterase [Halobacteriaceae archaeon]